MPNYRTRRGTGAADGALALQSKLAQKIVTRKQIACLFFEIFYRMHYGKLNSPDVQL